MRVPKTVGKRGQLVLELLKAQCDASNCGAVRIENEHGFMTLVIENIGDMMGHPLYAVAHVGEQNGDVMYDPEVIFWATPAGWYPTTWRNDYLGINQTSMKENEEKPGNLIGNWAVQNDLCVFCNMWMKNLRDQFNLNPMQEVAI